MGLGSLLIRIGLALLLLLGAVVRYAPGLVLWFGHLPGDIRIERGGLSIFLPITSMLIVSAIASGVMILFYKR